MIDYLGMVKEFHEKFGHHTQSSPFPPPDHIARLRRKLIQEESWEFNEAATSEDLVEVADALADLLYVTFGAALAYGLPIGEIFTEVHRSNMTKSLLKDGNGKTVKGPDFEHPRLGTIIAEAIRRG